MLFRSPVPTPNPPAPVPPPSSKDVTPPAIQILSPNFTVGSTSNPSVTISGSASDNVGVTSVKWSDGYGNTGQATGTTAWSATVPLLSGTNVITIRAYDAAGNSGWRSLTIVRR